MSELWGCGPQAKRVDVGAKEDNMRYLTVAVSPEGRISLTIRTLTPKGSLHIGQGSQK